MVMPRAFDSFRREHNIIEIDPNLVAIISIRVPYNKSHNLIDINRIELLAIFASFPLHNELNNHAGKRRIEIQISSENLLHMSLVNRQRGFIDPWSNRAARSAISSVY